MERCRIDNKTVYRYWKEKCGLVNKVYAMKMLGVSSKKFDKIKTDFNLVAEEHSAPYSSWKTKLYKLKDIREIKDKIVVKNS